MTGLPGYRIFGPESNEHESKMQSRHLLRPSFGLADCFSNPIQFRAAQHAYAPVLICPGVKHVGDVLGTDPCTDGTLGIENSWLAALRAGNDGVHIICTSEGNPSRELGLGFLGIHQ
jgi:hypothetical protein